MRALFGLFAPRAALLVVGTLGLCVGCGQEAVDCEGPGLTLVDGRCEVASSGTACPAGTRAVDDACVAADAWTADGVAADAGTEPDAGGGDAGVVPDGDIGAGPDACVPSCAPEKACGGDGCGGSCGTCSGGEACMAGVCKDPTSCVASCVGKVCGDDGCGGSCGSCGDPAKPLCEAGLCVAPCVPSCVGKVCGPDGCGGACGTCAKGEQCAPEGLCVPGGWSCPATKYAASDQCDCQCGAADPDCDDPYLVTLGCAATETCAAGSCAPKVPKGWTCDLPSYGDGVFCDCGCGLPDPDCKLPGAYVTGCPKAGQTCGPKGTCVACVPDCKGKVCGGDGCGGFCGTCPAQPAGKAPLACIDGKCVDGCGPKPLLCETHTCGPDGCGGSCGTCPVGAFCDKGQCAPEPGKSCVGYCKGKAPGGCSCSDGCVQAGTCCTDFLGECTCKPDCKGKVCGDDGCGGSCGACTQPGAKFCGPKGQCQGTCAPQCTNKACGDDGCGGSCGTCPGGTACVASGGATVCVPPTWTCPAYYYGDGSACDCGCGAPDPDCEKIALTEGCPQGVSCNKKTGLCDMALCTHDKDCKPPKWCIGHYPAGKGLRKGICQTPDPVAATAYSPCNSDEACVSGLCGAGLCRAPCQQDAHCAQGGRCVGFVAVQGLTLQPLGVFGGCDVLAKLGKACTSQAACGKGERCLAVIDPSTLKASYRCGILPSASSEGEPCAGPHRCAIGLVCKDGKCMRPCPGGDKDCPFGLKCGKGVLHGGTSALPDDDVVVPTCVP